MSPHGRAVRPTIQLVLNLMLYFSFYFSFFAALSLRALERAQNGAAGGVGASRWQFLRDRANMARPNAQQSCDDSGSARLARTPALPWALVSTLAAPSELDSWRHHARTSSTAQTAAHTPTITRASAFATPPPACSRSARRSSYRKAPVVAVARPTAQTTCPPARCARRHARR